jgi:hypothetical protein
MKKLGKLSINPSKVMKNEELVNLKGGYGGGYDGPCCMCTRGVEIIGYIVGSSESECPTDCKTLYGGSANGGWHHQC